MFLELKERTEQHFRYAIVDISQETMFLPCCFLSVFCFVLHHLRMDDWIIHFGLIEWLKVNVVTYTYIKSYTSTGDIHVGQLLRYL